MENVLTIAMPVFDRAEFFSEALASALQQTIATPVIVVDNASTRFDFAKAVRDCGNPRVTYHRNPANVGMIENWNQCLRLAQTRWVSILHDDDVLYERAVDWLLQAIAAMPGRGLYFGLDDVMDERSRATRNKVETDPAFTVIDPATYAVMNQFCACGFAIDREAALASGGYDRRWKMTADWDLYSRMSVRHGAVRVNRVISAYREPTLRDSCTAALALRGVLLPSYTLQRKRNLRDYQSCTSQRLAVAPRLHQAAIAHRLLATIGSRMTRRGFRAACLYAALELPENRVKAAFFRLSPALYFRLVRAYSWFWESRRRLMHFP